MKLQELLVQLRKLARSHPDAEVHFNLVEYVGNGTSTSGAEFVDARSVGADVTIRVTEPGRVADVLSCTPNAESGG